MFKIIRYMFFILVFVMWAALNSYVFIRIWQALSIPPGFKIFYIAVAVLVALSMPLTMMLRENLSPGWSGTLQMISGTWMIILVYAALLFLFFDILRAVHYFVHFFPEVITGNYVLAKRILFSVGVLTVGIILAAGHWKFNHPQIARLELTTEKPLGPDGKVELIFFSDLHLGSLVSSKQLEHYVELIGREKYDMLLIGGDFTDGDHDVWKKRNFAGILSEIRPRYGTYVAMGNHEYYNGVQESLDFIRSAGFIPLKDQSFTIPEKNITLVGRDDRTNTSREAAEELITPLDHSYYIITMDHQPAELAQVARAGADLLLCGHTHNGQVFPLTVLIKLMWEVAYGYKRIGDMDLYVSSGLGLWGPQYRIGSDSEIVHITIRENRGN